MKQHFKQQLSKWINNKKGSGEVALILLLMVLGLFFLSKFVFKIDFPTKEDSKTEINASETVNTDSSKEN